MKKQKFFRIEKDKYDPHTYFHIGNGFFHFYNEWSQVVGKYNWYSFTPIHIYFENEIMTGGFEFEFTILGFGIRYRYNYSDEWLKQYEDEINQIKQEHNEN